MTLRDVLLLKITSSAGEGERAYFLFCKSDEAFMSSGDAPNVEGVYACSGITLVFQWPACCIIFDCLVP